MIEAPHRHHAHLPTRRVCGVLVRFSDRLPPGRVEDLRAEPDRANDHARQHAGDHRQPVDTAEIHFNLLQV